MNGKKLRELRLERKLTLQQLATLSGYSKSGLSEIENGIKTSITTGTLKGIAKALHVDYKELLD